MSPDARAERYRRRIAPRHTTPAKPSARPAPIGQGPRGLSGRRGAGTGTRALIAALALVTGLALTACGAPPAASGSGSAQPTVPTARTPSAIAPSAATPSTTAAPPTCVDGTWSCVQQARFVAVTGYIRRIVGAHGYLSAVFTDRVSGAVWRTGDTTHPGWTASTIKLAVATDLLRRQRAGQIALSAADRHDIATMLNFSDEAASDRLWKAYGGDAMLARFRTEFGMAGLHFVPGFTTATYWGFVKCTADDLAALMHYVLTSTNPADRDYLVAAMRGVAPNQQWGVWGAGAAQRPGNKDGWSFESDSYGKHWVTDTVGFAGPDERYTVAIMYQVGPSGSLAEGVHAVSDVAALLFGAPTPAPITVPAPDG